MEAMAVGVPVVAHPTAGARELLAGQEVVAHAPECTGQSFADAFATLASEDAQRALVTRARRWLETHASLDHYVETLEAELRCASLRAPPPQLPRAGRRHPFQREVRQP